MSGVIGVGSKSGIIGSTEIPDGYEYGEWTATLESGAADSTDTTTAYYIKIGKMVHIAMSSTFGTNTMNNSQLRITGVPFTCATPSCGSTGSTARINIPDDAGAVGIPFWLLSSTTIYGYTMYANQGGSNTLMSQSSGSFGPSYNFSLTFRIA